MQELSIGVDIGGTNVSYGFVTGNGEVISKNTFSIREFEKVEGFIDYLTENINKTLKGLNKEYKIKGTGIGAPNGNFYKGTIEHAPNLKWKGIIPFAKMLEEKLKNPVVLTNDANAAAMGEMIYGNAKGMDDFMMVTLGTGLGSGFVANGKLILGHDGFAGELGHSVFDPKGRLCGCGRKGCLEQYASAPGIVKTVVELLNENNNPSLLRNYAPKELSSELIYKAAIQKDATALKAFDNTGYILGFMLANAVTITSPQVIFLFGGLANAGELIFGPVKRYMEENLLNIFKNKIDIRPSGLPENDAAILGAAALVK